MFVSARIATADREITALGTRPKERRQDPGSSVNFKAAVERTRAHQVIYLSGIVNEKSLSRHLRSRKRVEDELSRGSYHFTVFRAGIIVGSGSASFEIIRDLVEKLPVMVAPKWLRTRCQPIAIIDVITILEKALGNVETFDDNFDIGGKDILSYQLLFICHLCRHQK